MSVLELRGNEI